MRFRLMGVMSLNVDLCFHLGCFFLNESTIGIGDPLILKLVKKDRHELT